MEANWKKGVKSGQGHGGGKVEASMGLNEGTYEGTRGRLDLTDHER